MADIYDMMAYEKKVTEYIDQIDEEAPLNKIVALGAKVIAMSILALGVRLDYLTRDINRHK